MRRCTLPGCDRKHEAHGFCKLHYRRNRGEHTTKVEATCEQCGVTYQRAKRARTRLCLMCCELGRRAKISAAKTNQGRTRWPQSAVTWRECRTCGRWHTAENPATLFVRLPGGGRKAAFCSSTCHAAYQHVRLHICPDCGVSWADQILPGRGALKRCASCTKADRRSRHKAWVRQARLAGTYSGDNHRQRARHYGVAYEPINSRAVYDRDGWICGICDGAVDPGLAFPDLMSASLDHIVPMSLGGPHLWHNVQLAHLICNSRKGARLQPQPAGGGV